MKHCLCLLLSLLLTAASCAPVENTAEPAPETSVPVPTVLADPTPLNEALLHQEVYALWSDSLSFDIMPYLPNNMFDPEAPWRVFATSDEDRLWLPQCRDALSDAAASALIAAAEKYASGCAKQLAFSYDVQCPNWQMIYAAVCARFSADEANRALNLLFELDANIPEQSDDAAVIELRIYPLPYKQALRNICPDDSAYMSACFTYSYALTVYDEAAVEADYVQPPAEGNLASGITWPLASHTRLRKTWYYGRSNNTRKHTGTDIWAKEGTEIYSCTDGTVTFVGFGQGMGNAVIITDDFGYEFHYYHMVNLTDFLTAGDRVTAGELIGHVGNTGNSDLDHLHLTIAAPDGTYVNPYPYLAAIQPRKSA